MKLSSESQKKAKAVDLAKKTGENKLFRHEGGFWAGREFKKGHDMDYVTTETVRTLVGSGIAKYSGFKKNKGSFSVEITIKDHEEESFGNES